MTQTSMARLVSRSAALRQFLFEWHHYHCVPHTDETVLEGLTARDVVIGQLDVPLVAAVQARGARYLHIHIDRPAAALDALDREQLTAAGLRLLEYSPIKSKSAPRLMFDRLWRGWRYSRAVGALGKVALTTGGIVFALSVLKLQECAAMTLAAGLGLHQIAKGELCRAPEQFSNLFRAVPDPALAEPQPAYFTIALVWLLATFAWAALVYRFRHHIVQCDIMTSATVRPAKVLIMALSSSKIEKEELDRVYNHSWAEILRVSGVKFNWQQNLRAMNPHLDHLQRVIVLTSTVSTGKDGFDRFAAKTRTVLAKGQRSEIQIIEHKTDQETFDDVDVIYKIIHKIITDLKSDHNIAPEDICIDGTGGTKPFFLPVALVTFNTGSRFSYVDNAGKILEYDGRIAVGGIKTS